MDKRALASLFRDRLREIAANRKGGLSRFGRDAGIDRSALSQFADPRSDRLPRADSLRRMAEAAGVSADWLLGLSDATDATQEVSESVDIEAANLPEGGSPLDRWLQEALGRKIRYVPSIMPDLLSFPEVVDLGLEHGRVAARTSHSETMLAAIRAGEVDMEIAMPLQSYEELTRGNGIWTRLDPALRRRQVAEAAELVSETYPALRLHLYDAATVFSAPYTVFGTIRAALYLGRAYLVVTSREQVLAFSRHFDDLVRESAIPADQAGGALAKLAEGNADWRG